MDILGIEVDNCLKIFSIHFVLLNMADERKDIERRREEARGEKAEHLQKAADASRKEADAEQELANKAREESTND